MSARMIVELPDGKKLLFGGRAPETGLAEIGIGEEIASASSERFQAALGTLGELVAVLEKSLGQLTNLPDKIEMEFGASLSGDCNLWIVSGEGKAEFKVKLVWEKPKVEK